MRHIPVHGAQGGADAVVSERAQPAGGPVGLLGMGAQHVDEEDLREMFQDQGTPDGRDLDLGQQEFAEVFQECTARIRGTYPHELRQYLGENRVVYSFEREASTADVSVFTGLGSDADDTVRRAVPQGSRAPRRHAGRAGEGVVRSVAEQVEVAFFQGNGFVSLECQPAPAARHDAKSHMRKPVETQGPFPCGVEAGVDHGAGTQEGDGVGDRIGRSRHWSHRFRTIRKEFRTLRDASYCDIGATWPLNEVSLWRTDVGLLDGKTAVITGGSTGIGLASAVRLAAEGAYVFVSGRRKAELDAAVETIGAARATAVVGDVAEAADLDRLYDAVRARGEGLDVLFANAAVGPVMLLEQITAEHLDQVFGVNVRGTLFTVQGALPLLNDGASIILTGSTAADNGAEAFGAYAASKAAIRSFARTWSNELKGRGIRVNVVSPGGIETPGLASTVGGDAALAAFKDRVAGKVAKGRIGFPEEVAAAVAFLASEQSSYIVGANLYVDGGQNQI